MGMKDADVIDNLNAEVARLVAENNSRAATINDLAAQVATRDTLIVRLNGELFAAKDAAVRVVTIDQWRAETVRLTSEVKKANAVFAGMKETIADQQAVVQRLTDQLKDIHVANPNLPEPIRARLAADFHDVPQQPKEPAHGNA